MNRPGPLRSPGEIAGGSAVRRNIELKARLASLDQARRTARRLATEVPAPEHQRDTYFVAAKGRLKLREINDRHAQLIAYARPDQAEHKASDYVIHRVAEPATLKEALERTLGILVVVDKQREIYLVDNVRIHLDRVAELGTFLEFEAVLDDPHQDADDRVLLGRLESVFGIRAEDRICGSYSDLLLARTEGTAGPTGPPTFAPGKCGR